MSIAVLVHVEDSRDEEVKTTIYMPTEYPADLPAASFAWGFDFLRMISLRFLQYSNLSRTSRSYQRIGLPSERCA